MCLGSYQLLLPPETYCRLQGHENEGRSSWTNVFRAETEAKLTEAEAGAKEPLYCLTGSFSENDEKIEFNITRRFCNDQLDYFVCTTGEASATTTSQITIAKKTMKKDSSASFNIGHAGFFKTTNIDKQEVPLSTAVYEHSQNSEVRTSVTPTSNESYGLASINSVHTYAVVNKIRKIYSKLQKSDETFTDTSYGEYDRLNGVSTRRTHSKTNVYDSHAGIRNESDPTYDSSNHGGRKLKLDNDVYDHTDTLSTDGCDYGYSSTPKSNTRNENDVYDKLV
ncbi:unnamed protein product [Mytilus coruscus]|uniref:Uncharacterized protein n=1 Tax=Mytilus coruscus TaxID=42192 RepID=A0A6J8ELH3_MYTCO|nr:unnamed protein product [Mytilus coruscus]